VTVAKTPDTTTLYHAQIGQARRFIREHATRPLTLERIARDVGRSPFHFSRLFKALTGETVFEFVVRVRLVIAARMLSEQPKRTVTDVALAVGYEAVTSFNKAFRDGLGTSPTKFRAFTTARRDALVSRLQVARPVPQGDVDVNTTPEIREREDRVYLFVRRHGPYADEAPRAWIALHRIVDTLGLIQPGNECIGAAYDEPGVVTSEALRYDAGITVDGRTRTPKGLQRAMLPGGSYAVFRYCGSYAGIGRAFDVAIAGWSMPDDLAFRRGPCLEIYRNNPDTTPPAELLTELCLPVEAV
jgi:AraC family transcriptional regulator